jgi:hypothetical protein
METTMAPAPVDRPEWTPFGLDPGWTGWLLSALTLAIWIVAASIPGGHFGLILVAAASTVCLVVAWTLRLLLAGTLRLWRKRPFAWRRFLVQPLLVAAVAGVVLVRSPLHIRFDLSRGAMNRTAVAVMAGREDPRTIHHIGLFSVQRAEWIPGGFRFLVSSSGFLDGEGFAYSPDGPPAVVGEDEYEHYSGPWYLWSESW